MKQRYHTIIKPQSTGWFVGWVEEIPGTITHGKSLQECRENLREALELMIETHRDAFNPVYAAMIETLDDAVGRLMAKVASLGLVDRTIFVFTSDNGGLHVLESPGTPATHNRPYRAGKGYLYDGGLRVPLLVRWPGVVAREARSA